MATLYDLGNELKEKGDEIYALLDDGADPESSEIQEKLQALISSEQNWKEKAVNVGKFIHQMMKDEEMLKNEAKRLDERAKKINKFYAYLQELLMLQMTGFGVDEIQDPILPLKIKQNPYSVKVIDEKLIPMDFKREKITVEIDKRALLKARENGGVAGVEFVRTKKLAIG